MNKFPHLNSIDDQTFYLQGITQYTTSNSIIFKSTEALTCTSIRIISIKATDHHVNSRWLPSRLDL